MKGLRQFIGSALVGGLLVLAPIYIAVLLLLKAMQSIEVLIRPLTKLLPAWFPAVQVVSLVLVVVLCFLVGLLVRTRPGRRTREQIERALFDKIPGYSLFKKLAQQVAGTSQEMTWKPALVEIEEALVPAFIIEELDDGSYTVFVPSVPTPFQVPTKTLNRPIWWCSLAPISPGAIRCCSNAWSPPAAPGQA